MVRIASSVHIKLPRALAALLLACAVGASAETRLLPVDQAAHAGVIGTLDVSVVERAAPMPVDRGWSKLTFAPDKLGFVDARLLHSPIDDRLRVATTEPGWRASLSS